MQSKLHGLDWLIKVKSDFEKKLFEITVCLAFNDFVKYESGSSVKWTLIVDSITVVRKINDTVCKKKDPCSKK